MMNEQKWHFEIWIKGVHYDDAEIVSVTEASSHLDESWAEPGPSLKDIEAVFRFVQRQFPDGWRIEDGEVLAGKHDRHRRGPR